ncbi:CNH domain family protein [Babesia bovis T2Bo]|uniref:CNH domain-containing protein n=1 Tax=Babesia bovis TaxID=5865 RepID=A7AQR5_BABBO|nr:CNH domain family protein [Babesia bovis T2Bo]EDO06884.1 CNH domain family protein [Babesia bovis T2Bo]|eukprot:XP_001610452.1 hypothetical protein [Babesia bovis T2Bo]
MEIFSRDVVLRWMESSKITAVAWCNNDLVIGNDAGELHAFQCPELQGPVEAEVYKYAKVSNQKIASITPLEPEGWILVLNSNGDLYSINSMFKGQPSILVKNVTCVARQFEWIYFDSTITQNAKGTLCPLNEFCVGTDGKMYIYAAQGGKLTPKRCISVDGMVLSASWINNTIVVGTKEAYYIMDAECKTCRELCSLQTGDLDSEVVPLTTPCVDGDVMVICQNIGIFYNTQTMALSKKNTILWRNRLEALGCASPFIIGITVDRIVEVYGVRDQLPYQVIDQTSAKYVHFMPQWECMLSATPNVVMALKHKTYHQTIAEAVESKDIKQVLHIANVYFATEDPQQVEEKKLAHTIAGWMRFNDLNFPLAFHHFTLGNVDIVYLLQFWNHYADIALPESYVSNEAVPMLLRQYIPNATGIREFVERRYGQRKSELASKSTVAKLVELANVSFAAFLLKHLNNNALLQTKGIDMSDFQRTLKANIEKTCLLLLAECDDPKCSIIINRPKEETFLDLDSCKEHLIKMEKNEVLAKLLIQQKRYKEAMNIMVNYITDNVGSGHKDEIALEIKSVCCELANCLNTLIEQSQKHKDEVNKNTKKEEIHDILTTYLPVLLATYPNAALDVLTTNHAIMPFSTDQIIAMIDMHAPKSYCDSKMGMRIKYLEDLVMKNKHGGIHENTLLAQCYISELTVKRKNNDSKDDRNRAIKTMLIELMESNKSFNMSKLEDMLMKLNMVETTVLLNNKLNKHEEALRTLFQLWNKDNRLKACEAYCLCFGEIETSFDTSTMDMPFKRLFSNFDYWMQRANEWPLTKYEMYSINTSDASIDRLLLKLLNIIVQESQSDDTCIYLARDLLAKYIPLCTHNAAISGSAIVEIMPESWNFAIFANILMQLQLKALHEERTAAMRRGLTRSLRSQTAKQLYKLTCVPPITVDARSICAICQEPIKLGMSIAIPPPKQTEGGQKQTPRQHTIMHEECGRKVHDH